MLLAELLTSSGLYSCLFKFNCEMDLERTPPRKIIKLSSPDEEQKPPIIETSPSSMISQKEMQSLVLQHKLAKEVNFRENYMRQLLELYFLKSGGNILDFETWRKKVKSSHCLHFLQQNSLEPENAIILDFKTLEENSSRLLTANTKHAVAGSSVATLTPITHNNHTYVKIQSPVLNQNRLQSSPIPSTSISISSQLVTSESTRQSPQQPPSIPVVRNSSIPFTAIQEIKIEPSFTQTTPNVNIELLPIISSSSSPSLSPNSSQPIVDSMTTATVNQEQIVEKAKHEASVMQRITELQKKGLWSEKRLPKLQEPPRNKVHWDYLMEEMVWLSADFAQERKWKKAAAKKCARMIQKHFQDKAMAVQKAEKAHEQHLKRISSFIAKIVRNFWSDVERIVEYKTQLRLEEKRKQAFDQHLNLIVTQTEKYSKLLVEGMNKSGVIDTSTAMSTDALSETSERKSPADDVDFNVNDIESSEDDEESIARAERMQAKDDERAEIEALKEQSQMETDVFLSELPEGYLENRLMNDHLLLVNKRSDDDVVSGDADDALSTSTNDNTDPSFDESGQDSEDVEETILEQERLENDDKYNVEDELDALKADVDLPIDDLIAKYAPNSNKTLPTNQLSEEMNESEVIDKKRDEDIDDDNNNEDDTVDEENDEEMDIDDTADESVESEKEEDIGLKSLINETDSENRKKDLMDNVAAIAQSIQPKGNTLSSQEVVTKVPFLLKHSLREYQHIGLDWLVTMYDKNFNGILADEMGLGKTIQTIALLAHLACDKEIWGQHLVVVPTSVMLNWEMEFKKWCPAFKILTYYGSIKERRQKRQGWTKPNMFHVCITSYKLVIQDYKSFRGKKWHYLILDEAQNIKNFKSQRWQLLLNFNTKQRLLLTGTPLQNNLMELWSLMHFLMPNVFQSHREFKEWFSIPVTGMIEGNTEVDENTIKRLHKVLRPFLLRRLKSEVEKQMPKKYEQVVVCRLSKRQRYLYDDFMSRAKTKETLATGNLLSVINILMQLRKVCNHPNLFEDRPTISPFRMFGIVFYVASLITTVFEYDWAKEVNKSYLNLRMIDYENALSAYASYRFRKLSTPLHHFEKIDLFEPPAPPCPKNHIKIKLLRAKPIRIRIHFNNKNLEQIRSVPVGTSPTITIPKHIPPPPPPLPSQILTSNNSPRPPPPPYPFSQHQNTSLVPTHVPKNNHQFHGSQLQQLPSKAMMDTFGSRLLLTNFVLENNFQYDTNSKQVIKNECEVIRSCDRIVTELQIDVIQGPGLRPRQTRRIDCQKFQLSDKNKSNNLLEIIQNFYPMYIGSNISKITVNDEPIRIQENLFLSRPITTTLMDQLMYSDFSKSSKGLKLIKAATTTTVTNKDNKLSTIDKKLENVVLELRQQSLHRLFIINQRRCEAYPMYGNDLVSCIVKNLTSTSSINHNQWSNGHINCNNVYSRNNDTTELLNELVLTPEQLVIKLENILEKYVVYVPAVVAPPISFHSSHPPPSQFWTQKRLSTTLCFDLSNRCRFLHKVASAMATQFPDTRLIQYDCGKLQMLDVLLKRLKSENHRVLIFTQMTRMLDILEAFLNHHGHIYLRLDGSTKVEQRQILMERFNTNRKIFVFILSTRSGGIGVNLTGADTVIFYDSDWNPTMDAQAQDRCHRIGQTRDVHIYRLISDKTVEENILRKANQKRLLGDIAIEGGNFTTEFFKMGSIHELFKIDENSDNQQQAVNNSNLVPSSNNDNSFSETSEKLTVGALESALATCEDEMDVQAAKVAKEEAVAELAEFDESIPIEEQDKELEISKVDLEVQNLMKQLTPIEKYMMGFIEAVDSEWAQKQLQLADKEIELQKQEWEANQKREQMEEEERMKLATQDEDSEILTISRDEAVNKIWMCSKTNKEMTTWCPPTPPQDENDVFIDQNLAMLYDTSTIMIESQLPPIYTPRDVQKRKRYDSMNDSFGTFVNNTNRPIKCRKFDSTVPRSLFDHSIYTPKIRKDFRLQKMRPFIQISATAANGSTTDPSITVSTPLMITSSMRNIISLILNNTTLPLMQKSISDLLILNDWSITEDILLLKAIKSSLGDIFSSSFEMKPGQIVNWEYVSEFVTYHYKKYNRLPKYCQMRFENVIWPREESHFSVSSNNGSGIGSSDYQKKQKKKFFKQSSLNKNTNSGLKTVDLHNLDKCKTANEAFLKRYNTLRTVLKKNIIEDKSDDTNEEEQNVKFSDVCSSLDLNYETNFSALQLAEYRIERDKREKEKRLMLSAAALANLDYKQQQQQQQKMLFAVAKSKLLEQQRQQQIANIKQSLMQQQQQVLSPQSSSQIQQQLQQAQQSLPQQQQQQQLSQPQQLSQQSQSQQQQILNVIQQQQQQQQQQQVTNTSAQLAVANKLQRLVQSQQPPTMVSVSNIQPAQRVLVTGQNITNTTTKLITTAATSTAKTPLTSSEINQMYHRQQVKLRLANATSNNLMTTNQQQIQLPQQQPQPQQTLLDFNVQMNMPSQSQPQQSQIQTSQSQATQFQQTLQQQQQTAATIINAKGTLVQQQSLPRVQKIQKQSNQQTRTITTSEIAALIQRQQQVQQQQQQQQQQAKLTSVNAAQAVQILNQSQVMAQNTATPIQQIIATSSGHPVGTLVKANTIFSTVSVSPQMKAVLSQAQPIKVATNTVMSQQQQHQQQQQQQQQIRQIHQTVSASSLQKKNQTQKISQIPQVSNKGGYTQLIVQGGSKPMTIHQIIKQTNGTPVVLTKGAHGRMIPMPVPSSMLQNGIKQAVQVIGSPQLSTRSTQQSAATVVYTSASALANDFKLCQTTNNKGNIIAQLPQSFSPANQVRIQTTSGGPVVAVTVQPSQQQQQHQQQTKKQTQHHLRK